MIIQITHFLDVFRFVCCQEAQASSSPCFSSSKRNLQTGKMPSSDILENFMMVCSGNISIRACIGSVMLLSRLWG